MSRVVIVGGGLGGVFTAKALKGAISKGILEVTLVTPAEFVEWPGGHIRGLAVPKEADRSFAPSVVACVKGAKVVQGKAISVTSDAVMVASNGQSEPVTVPYDLLVIATGGRYANPTTAFLKSPEVRSRCSIAAGLPHLSRLADNTPRTSYASERDGA
jgi:NADH dehydrogenase FAD-containing subunit